MIVWGMIPISPLSSRVRWLESKSTLACIYRYRNACGFLAPLKTPLRLFSPLGQQRSTESGLNDLAIAGELNRSINYSASTKFLFLVHSQDPTSFSAPLSYLFFFLSSFLPTTPPPPLPLSSHKSRIPTPPSKKYFPSPNGLTPGLSSILPSCFFASSSL